MIAPEVVADGPLHELSREQRENNGRALDLVRERRRRLVTLEALNLGPAVDRLRYTGLLRFVEVAGEQWVEVAP